MTNQSCNGLADSGKESQRKKELSMQKKKAERGAGPQVTVGAQHRVTGVVGGNRYMMEEYEGAIKRIYSGAARTPSVHSRKKQLNWGKKGV